MSMEFVRAQFAPAPPRWSPQLRQQIVELVALTLGLYDASGNLPSRALWEGLENELNLELPLPWERDRGRPHANVLACLRTLYPDDAFTEVLMLVVRYLNVDARAYQQHWPDDLLAVDLAFARLNRWLAQTPLPYRVIDGELRDPGEGLAAEILEMPALVMLGRDPRFAHAARELQDAVDRRRDPVPIGAMFCATQALESTLHVIATELGWKPRSRALSDLLLLATKHDFPGGRELAGLTYFQKMIEKLVGAPRGDEPGEGHGAGAAALPNPILARFVVGIACAAIQALYETFSERTR